MLGFFVRRSAQSLLLVWLVTVVVFLLLFKLSLRDPVRMFLMRGYEFTHETVRDWEKRFAPLLGEHLRRKRKGKAGSRWYLDEKNHKEAMEIAARVTKQPAERFEWLFTKKDSYRDPSMLPNLDALQKNVDMTKDLGFVKASLDVKKHADLSIVQEAAKRLK